jgi:hypothetical protein
MRRLIVMSLLLATAMLPATITADDSRTASSTVIQTAPAVAQPNSTPAPVATLVVTSPPETPAPSPYAELWTATPIYAQGSLLGGLGCAPTAVSMIMGYYATQGHTGPSAAAIAAQNAAHVIPGVGLTYQSMLPSIYGYGYTNVTGSANTSLGMLKSALGQGPVIITAGVSFATGHLAPGSAAHSLVVIGVTADGTLFTVQDPFQGVREEIPTNLLNQVWARGSNGILIIRP